jgi:replicative superfamily II helicase
VAATLYDLLPRDEHITSDGLLHHFLEYVAARRLTLYPAQEAAVLELFEEKNVILSTPTGSGKSPWRWRCISRRWREGGDRSIRARSRRW